MTSQKTFESLMDFSRALGKNAVACKVSTFGKSKGGSSREASDSHFTFHSDDSALANLIPWQHMCVVQVVDEISVLLPLCKQKL